MVSLMVVAKALRCVLEQGVDAHEAVMGAPSISTPSTLMLLTTAPVLAELMAMEPVAGVSATAGVAAPEVSLPAKYLPILLVSVRSGVLPLVVALVRLLHQVVRWLAVSPPLSTNCATSRSTAPLLLWLSRSKPTRNWLFSSSKAMVDADFIISRRVR